MNDFFNRDINIAAVLKVRRAGPRISSRPRHVHFAAGRIIRFPLHPRVQFNDITPPIQSHLARVYRALAMTMAAAVAGCGLGSWASRDLSWLGLIGTLGTLMWLQFQSDKQNTGKRLAILAAHGVFQGLGLSSFVAVLHYIDPTIVPLALLATAAIFACFSGFALLSKRRSLLYLGGTLSSVLLVLTVGGLANSLLFRSAAFASLELYAGLAMFIGAGVRAGVGGGVAWRGVAVGRLAAVQRASPRFAPHHHDARACARSLARCLQATSSSTRS